MINQPIPEVKAVQERLALSPAPPAGLGIIVCKIVFSNAFKINSAHGNEILVTVTQKCSER